MLTSKEVAAMIKNDVAKLLHARIDELEAMILEILCDYQCVASCAEQEGYSTDYAAISVKADLLIKKGISL